MKRRVLAILCALCAEVSEAAEMADFGFGRWYCGVSGSLALPQGGSKMRRVGGAALRGGYYLTENWAAEGEAAWVEDCAGLCIQTLGHFQGWTPYGDLFGYSRLDPFVSFGARGWIGKACGQVGPKVGLGTFYHLTDAWSLRADADATLGLETNCEMLYSLQFGLQYSF